MGYTFLYYNAFIFLFFYNVVCSTSLYDEKCLKSNSTNYTSNARPRCNYIDRNVSLDFLCSVVIRTSNKDWNTLNKFFKIDMVIPGHNIVAKTEQSHMKETKWCTGIKSAHIYSLAKYPSEGQIDYHLEDECWTYFLSTLTINIHMDFNETSSYGFAQIEDQCRNNYSTYKTDYISCVPQVTLKTWLLKRSHSTCLIGWYEKSCAHYITEMGGSIQKISQLRGIKSTQLYYLTSLKVKYLNLSGNNFIENIEQQQFGFISVTYLNMSNCRIRKIDIENFKYTPDLLELDLSNNDMQELPEDFEVLTKLQYLDLSVKKTKEQRFMLPKGFRKLRSLRVLKLSHLNLYKFTRVNLPAAPHLTSLHLDFCNLYDLQDDVFLNFTQLKYLTLRGNYLAKLNLKFNLPSTAHVLYSAMLDVVDISLNNIRDMANLTFQYVRIDMLDLSKNSILGCNINYAYPVQNLNLSYNVIPVINNTNKEFFNNFESIDFGGNQFSCQECSIQEFQRYLRETKTSLLWFNQSSEPQCQNDGVLTSVLKVTYDEARCEGVVVDVPLISGVTSGLVVMLALAFTALLYVYRFEVAYVRHLLHVRAQQKIHKYGEGCIYDLFVSYCREDREWVLKVLCQRLENVQENYALCLYERDFALGSFIVDNIANCIEQSRHVMCVLSHNYVANEWCKWQLKMAQHRIFEAHQDFLILVELECLNRAQFPQELRMLMTSRMYLEWHKDQTSFWCRLKQVLGPALTQQQQLEAVLEDEELNDEEYYDNNPSLFIPNLT